MSLGLDFEVPKRPEFSSSPCLWVWTDNSSDFSTTMSVCICHGDNGLDFSKCKPVPINGSFIIDATVMCLFIATDDRQQEKIPRQLSPPHTHTLCIPSDQRRDVISTLFHSQSLNKQVQIAKFNNASLTLSPSTNSIQEVDLIITTQN